MLEQGHIFAAAGEEQAVIKTNAHHLLSLRHCDALQVGTLFAAARGCAAWHLLPFLFSLRIPSHLLLLLPAPLPRARALPACMLLRLTPACCCEDKIGRQAWAGGCVVSRRLVGLGGG